MKLISRHTTPAGPRTTVQQGLSPSDAYMLMQRVFEDGGEAAVLEDGATINMVQFMRDHKRSMQLYAAREVKKAARDANVADLGEARKKKGQK